MSYAHHAVYYGKRTITLVRKGKCDAGTDYRFMNTATHLTYWPRRNFPFSLLNLCRTNASGPSETTATDLLSDRRYGLWVGTLTTSPNTTMLPIIASTTHPMVQGV